MIFCSLSGQIQANVIFQRHFQENTWKKIKKIRKFRKKILDALVGSTRCYHLKSIWSISDVSKAFIKSESHTSSKPAFLLVKTIIIYFAVFSFVIHFLISNFKFRLFRKNCMLKVPVTF